MNSSPSQPTLAHVPARSGNPYLHLFYEHLGQAGIHVLANTHLWRRWLFKLWSPLPDYVHFHWPGSEYGHRHAWRTPFRALRFFLLLKVLRSAGVRIMWTFHNLMPHEGPHGRLGRHLRQRMVDRSDLILVNFRESAQHLSDIHGRSHDVHWVPHGSYAGHYPDTRTGAEARRELGIEEDAFVFLVFGSIRPYKNITGVIEAFKLLEDPRARLLIAGRAMIPSYARTIRALAEQDARIIVHDWTIPDEDVQNFFRGSDMIVLPRTAYSSGTAVLALDFGLPLLAPRVNHVAEIALDRAVVPLQGESTGELLEGLQRALATDLAGAREDALRSSQKLAWDPIAESLADILRADHEERS